MATAARHLSSYDPKAVPSGKGRRIALITSEWNEQVTGALHNGARETLLKHGVKPVDIVEHWVPGSFELPGGAQFALRDRRVDAVICIGSVVRGETPHFDYV